MRNGGVMEERNILSTSHLALELPSIACYGRIDRRRHRSDGRLGF